MSVMKGKLYFFFFYCHVTYLLAVGHCLSFKECTRK